MKFEPKNGILIVSRNKNTELDSDMYVTETDDDKRLITCTVVSGNDRYNTWEIVVTGRYSTYQLAYKGTDYLFLDEEDVLSILLEE